MSWMLMQDFNAEPFLKPGELAETAFGENGHYRGLESEKFRFSTSEFTGIDSGPEK